MGASIGRGHWVRTPPLPLENYKAIGFLSKIGPDLLENHKATKPTIYGMPEKRHLNGVRWLAYDCLLSGNWILSLPHQLKKQQRPCQTSLTKLSVSVHGLNKLVFIPRCLAKNSENVCWCHRSVTSAACIFWLNPLLHTSAFGRLWNVRFFKILWKMENLLLRSKCSNFHNILKTVEM